MLRASGLIKTIYLFLLFFFYYIITAAHFSTCVPVREIYEGSFLKTKTVQKKFPGTVCVDYFLLLPSAVGKQHAGPT